MASLYKQVEELVKEFASKYNLRVKRGKLNNAFYLYKEWQVTNDKRKRKMIYVRVLKSTVFVAGYTNIRTVTHYDWMENHIEHYRNSVSLQELWQEMEKVYRMVFV